MLNKEDETNNDSNLGTEQPDSSPVMKLSPDMGKDLDDPNSLWERSSFLCVAYTILLKCLPWTAEPYS